MNGKAGGTGRFLPVSWDFFMQGKQFQVWKCGSRLPEQCRVLPPDPPATDIPDGADEHHAAGTDERYGREREAG